MECQHCHNMALKDWSSGNTTHAYCAYCGAHYHNGTWYTKEEWFFFINEQKHLQTLEECYESGSVREGDTGACSANSDEGTTRTCCRKHNQ